jgi:hypothetical protein
LAFSTLSLLALWDRLPIRGGSMPWKVLSPTPRSAAPRSERHGNQGFFFSSTVVTSIPDGSRLMTEEPFGPVAPITPFKTFDEVVDRANALPFGLAAYTFTTSTRTANLISDALEAGMVGRRHEGKRLWPRGRRGRP